MPPDPDQFGYIRISRKLYENDRFWNEPRVFSRHEAWEDFIQMASWKDQTRLVGNELVELKRGELLASIRYLASRWRWSPKKVRIYLDLLAELERVRAQRGAQGGTVYLLVNYDDYQEGSAAKGTAGDRGTAKGTAKGTARGTARGTADTLGDNENGDDRGTARGTDRGTAKGTNRSKEEVRKEKNPAGSKRKWTFVPESWEPNAAHRSLAKELGVAFDIELAKFRDHEFDRAKSDPDRTFSNWIRTAASRSPAKNGKAPPHQWEYNMPLPWKDAS